MGPEVTELEEELGRFVGVEHVVGCSSGTDALLLPLMAHGIGPGDAVFTTPFTFIATAEVVALLGATPVFVDIDAHTFNMDPNALAQALDRVLERGALRPRGVIPVDLFGIPADYDPICAIAGEHRLFVLEDAAQSFGAAYKGRRTGSLGDVAATSFFPAKPLGAYGDGGAVFTNDERLAETMRSLRVHGHTSDRYNHARVGLNARLDTLQAAILLAKLSLFEDELSARKRVATRYTERLRDTTVTPSVPDDVDAAWGQYSILSERRDEIRSALTRAGIPFAIYYPVPLHLQSVFVHLGHNVGDFPVCERIASNIISLPMHPYLEDAQIDSVCDTVNRAVCT